MEEKQTTRKEMIFEAARRLYYANGFNETSFDGIAREAGVNRALIQYHFTTKAGLGSAIYGQYSAEQFDVFTKKVRDSGCTADPATLLTAYTLQTLEYYRIDRNAFRFYREFFSGAFEYMPELIGPFSEESGLSADIPRELVEACYISTQYALRGVIYHYVTGGIRLNRRDLELYLIGLLTGHGLFGPVEPEKTAAKARDINEKMSIRYLDSFRWA